jgi:hypothetical protein
MEENHLVRSITRDESKGHGGRTWETIMRFDCKVEEVRCRGFSSIGASKKGWNF